jgi:hypothetical protein
MTLREGYMNIISARTKSRVSPGNTNAIILFGMKGISTLTMLLKERKK